MSAARSPRRLMDPQSDASPEVRALLASASDDGPTPRDLKALRAGLGLLGALPGSAAAHTLASGTTAAGTTTTVAVSKGLLVGAGMKAIAAGVALGVVGGTAFVTVARTHTVSDYRFTARVRPASSGLASEARSDVERSVSPPSPTPEATLPTPVTAATTIQTGSVVQAAPRRHESSSRPNRTAPLSHPARPEGAPGFQAASSNADDLLASHPNLVSSTPVPANVPTPIAPVSRDTSSSTSDAVARELTLLQPGFDALRAGRFQAALDYASRHAAAFPQGMMAQEREVIAIEALIRLDRRAEARDRADQFRAAFPSSGHLIRVDALLNGGRSER